MVGAEVVLEGVEFSRGSANVKIAKAVFRKGDVVAVTGANGSGKSSLFGLLQGCARGGVLPPGVNVTLYKKILVRSNDVVLVALCTCI